MINKFIMEVTRTDFQYKFKTGWQMEEKVGKRDRR